MALACGTANRRLPTLLTTDHLLLVACCLLLAAYRSLLTISQAACAQMLLGALAALAALAVGQASPYAANSVQAALTMATLPLALLTMATLTMAIPTALWFCLLRPTPCKRPFGCSSDLALGLNPTRRPSGCSPSSPPSCASAAMTRAAP